MDRLQAHLRQAREVSGLTQQALADRVGVRQPHVARWESGAQLPRVDTAMRLAAALGTTVEAIWTMPDLNEEAPTSGGVTTSEVR